MLYAASAVRVFFKARTEFTRCTLPERHDEAKCLSS
jgi:hypothetical protein